MAYSRVIPRDLFNEANLLKCLGQLYLCLEALPGQPATLGDIEPGEAFDIQQDEADGSLEVVNLPFTMGDGRSYRLTRPLNSRETWPLWCECDDGDEVPVFTGQGVLSPAFLALLPKA